MSSPISSVDHSLPRGCTLCSLPTAIICQGCLVTPYCGAAHKDRHSLRHKAACGAVSGARTALARHEAVLRAWNAPAAYIASAAVANGNVTPIPAQPQPGDAFTSLNGHFWEAEVTRDFMLARMDLVRALRRIRTTASVREQLSHVDAMLSLSVHDEVMARIVRPALLLRLGRDGDCFEFIKAWSARKADVADEGVSSEAGGQSRADDAPNSRVNSRRSEAFGHIEHLFDDAITEYDGTVLEHAVATILLKVKLLLDLSALEKATVLEQTSLGRRLPRELQFEIRRCLPESHLVYEDSSLVCGGDHTDLIQKLDGQINRLYSMVNSINNRFFPSIVDHYRSFDAKFKMWDRAGVTECPGDLRNSYDSWLETKGALDFMAAKVRNDPTSLRRVYLHF